MIYLTPEDWNNFFLPKLLQDHKSLDAELKKIKNIYSIMSFINSKIKISNQVILSLSMIYFHKYYNQTLINLINLSPIEKLIICGSCIFIATKTLNHLIRVSVIVNIIIDIINKKFPDLKIESDLIKEKIFQKEFEILQSIGFSSNFDLPYKFVLRLKNYFEKNTNISSEILIKSCCQYISDSFLLPVSLYYTPNIISISCINIMKEQFNLVDINLNHIITLSEYKIDLNELNECYSIINKLYVKKENSSSISTSFLSTNISN